MKSCGSCTLCCELMKVEMEPPKPARSQCGHCTKAGCGIYDDRPTPCREFQCLWLASQSRAPMPAALRPDRTGVVLEPNSVGYIIAHSKQPMAWRRAPMVDFLKRAAARTVVLINTDVDNSVLLHTDGTTEPLIKIGVDEATNETIWKRGDHADD